MPPVMPPVEFLSEDTYYSLLDVAYNPAPEFTSEFVKEHEHPHIQMKRALFALGGGKSSGPFSYEAFSAMEDCWTTSRIVQATLVSESFVRPDLVRQLFAIVEAFVYDYAMHIDTDFDSIPDFAFFITKRRIAVFAPDRTSFARVHDRIG